MSQWADYLGNRAPAADQVAAEPIPGARRRMTSSCADWQL
jgi:hypothetical protein